MEFLHALRQFLEFAVLLVITVAAQRNRLAQLHVIACNDLGEGGQLGSIEPTKQAHLGDSGFNRREVCDMGLESAIGLTA